MAAEPGFRKQWAPIIKITLVLLVTGTMVLLVWMHVAGINGPFYWKWHWRRFSPVALAAPMALAAVPFFLGQWIYASWRKLSPALVLLALSTFLLQLAAAQPPSGLARPVHLIRDRQASSFFTDASIAYHSNLSLRELLTEYPRYLPLMGIHSRSKPPGPLLFHLLILRIVGEGTAPLIIAIAIALLAALAVPLCWWMIASTTKNTHAGFVAAGFLALCPSLVLVYPQLDQVYATMSILVVTLWLLAMLRHSNLMAAGFGLMFGLATFTSYIFLGLIVFLGVFTILHARDRGKSELTRILAEIVTALAAFAAFYFVLYLAFGFNPVATFQSVDRQQTKILVEMGRPFPYHVPFDLLDFLLGSGWLSALLILMLPARTREATFKKTMLFRLAWIALLQVLMVDLAAVLPGESARLWLPFLPLLMIPVGAELAIWRTLHRTIVYACLLVITFTLARNMIFVYAGPRIDGLRPYYLPFQSPQKRARMEKINPDPPAEPVR